jgi:hypothetical protein
MARAKKPDDQKELGPRKDSAHMWTYYHVRWEFFHRVCGSIPADPALIQAWLDSRKPTVRPVGGKSIQEINEEVIATLAEIVPIEEQYQMLVFQRVNGQVCARAGSIRAHMKDCSRQISSFYVGRIERERTFSMRVVNCVYLPTDCYWIPYRSMDGQILTESAGVSDKAAHAMTPRGPVSFLKRIEYLERPVLEFELKVLGPSVHEDDLHILFQYGGTHGYGGERGDGEGRYEYTLERIERSEPLGAA